MHRHSSKIFLPLCLLMMGPITAGSEETLEDVQRSIRASWVGVRSMSARLEIDADIRRSGIRAVNHFEGSVLMRRSDGEAIQFRTELSGEAKVGPLGFFRLKIEMLTVSDGEFQHVESRTRGSVKVIKSKVESHSGSAPGGGANKLTALSEKYELTLLPRETFEGREVYVIEGVPREGVEQKIPELHRIVFYFDVDLGAQVRVTGFSRKGKLITEAIFRDFQFDADVSDEDFAYTVPRGAEFDDQTSD